MNKHPNWHLASPCAALFAAAAIMLAPPSEARDLSHNPSSDPVAQSGGRNLTGPTLRLDYGTDASSGNSLAEFMYFVPLIAPEPVATTQSPGNTQCARVVSSSTRTTDKTFIVTYEYEFVGQGNQINALDHSDKIRRHEQELKSGHSLDEQLASISITGSGLISIEAEGTMDGATPNITEVRLRFNAHGRPSPVTVGIHDLKYVDGHVISQNEIVARVNTLTFRKQGGQPKMELSLASVKAKDAGDSLWQNFVGGIKGSAANLFIKPIVIQNIGNQAMLDFGRALASHATTFTFPHAANLLTSRASAPAPTR